MQNLRRSDGTLVPDRQKAGITGMHLHHKWRHGSGRPGEGHNALGSWSANSCTSSNAKAALFPQDCALQAPMGWLQGHKSSPSILVLLAGSDDCLQLNRAGMTITANHVAPLKTECASGEGQADSTN